MQSGNSKSNSKMLDNFVCGRRINNDDFIIEQVEQLGGVVTVKNLIPS